MSKRITSQDMDVHSHRKFLDNDLNSPFDRFFRVAPAMWARWLLQCGSNKFSWDFIMRSRLISPRGRNGIILFLEGVYAFIRPKELWIVMNENGRVPSTTKLSGTAVKALGRLIEQDISTSQHDFVCFFRTNGFGR